MQWNPFECACKKTLELSKVVARTLPASWLMPTPAPLIHWENCCLGVNCDPRSTPEVCHPSWRLVKYASSCLLRSACQLLSPTFHKGTTCIIGFVMLCLQFVQLHWEILDKIDLDRDQNKSYILASSLAFSSCPIRLTPDNVVIITTTFIDKVHLWPLPHLCLLRRLYFCECVYLWKSMCFFLRRGLWLSYNCFIHSH